MNLLLQVNRVEPTLSSIHAFDYLQLLIDLHQ